MAFRRMGTFGGGDMAAATAIAAATLFAASPAAAAAQAADQTAAPTSPPPETSSPAEARVEDIIVTAQRREESLQRVPISVSAVAGEKLASVGITKIDDLGSAVPGLIAIPQLNSFSPIIRGIGQVNLAPGADLGVATYVDGVYQASPSGSNLNVGEIQRIEVLRGPQGTLFGRNATGGVVSIVTADPKTELQGYVTAAISDPQTLEGKFYVTGGLAQGVSASLAGIVTDQHDGFGTNLKTGTDAYYRDDRMVRGKLLAELSSRATLRLSADYARTKTDLGLSRRVLPGTLRLDGQPNPTGFHDTLSYLDPYAKVRQWGASGILDLDLGPVKSKTIIGYRDVSTKAQIDQSYEAIQIVNFINPFAEKTFTAETQILSSGSGFEWIVGLYYLHSDLTNNPVSVKTASISFITNNAMRINSYAAFAQGTLHLGPDTRLTVGGRYTTDEKRMTSSTNIIPLTTDRSRSWSEPTWRLSLDHQVTAGTLVYLSYNRGFKSGVFNMFDYPLAR